MKALVELGKTAAVLISLWAILLGVAWFGGAMRPVGGSTGASSSTETAGEVDSVADAGPIEAPRDAGAPAAEVDAGPVDAGPPDAGIDAATADRVELARWRIGPDCGSPSLAAATLFGRATPELVVTCGSNIEVIALEGLRASRVAHVRAPRATDVLAAPAVGDVNGDARNDLVVAMRSGQGLGGGGAYALFGHRFGGLADPVSVGRGPFDGVAVDRLDDQVGSDIALLVGSRAEAWLFRGGPTPVRAGSFATPVESRSIATLDLDRDGHVDLATVGPAQTTLVFGTGRLGVERTRSLAIGGDAVVVRDVDGDGAADLVLEGTAPCWMRASVESGTEGLCNPLGDEFRGARGLDVVTVDARSALVAWVNPRLLVRTNDALPAATWGELEGGPFGVYRHALLAPDAEGARILALVGRGVHEGAATLELGLVLLPPPSQRALLIGQGESSELTAAPLSLEIALPTPEAP